MPVKGTNRRAFIAAVGSAAAWPMMARAQQPPIPVIGFLGPTSATGYAPFLKGFHQGLSESGFVEGRDIAVEYRWADDQIDRLPALAAELVRRPVAVIATGGATAAALAAKAATATIPIVFAVGSDPVKFSLVASMSRPGGNVTGVTFLANALVAKRLELLQGLLPAGSMIGVLVNPGNANATADAKEAGAAAQSLGLHVQVVHADSEQDIDTAFADLVKGRAAALTVEPDPLFFSARERLVELAARHRMPAIYTNTLYAEAGGLMSYGTSQTDAFREAGIYAGRILKGEKPSDLPVVQSVRFELVINLNTAKALGLTVPPALLSRADEVIE
jgi:putative ABC transport system substrate-binding protein